MIGLATSTGRCKASVESAADFMLNADVVVHELAHIGVIDLDIEPDLRLLCGTERKIRNDVNDSRG